MNEVETDLPDCNDIEDLTSDDLFTNDCLADHIIITQPKPSEELERYLLNLNPKDHRALYAYAKYTLKQRWPEAERFIIDDPVQSYLYAYWIIKGRWPEAEEIISTEPSAAFNYARFVINGRWDGPWKEQAETTICLGRTNNMFR